MSSKRTHSSVSPQPSHSEASVKRYKASNHQLEGLKIYIIPAKLDPEEIIKLVELAEHAGAVLCSNAESAELLITAIGMRKRLERHIDWTLAKRKVIVKPSWLFDSVKSRCVLPCKGYVALEDLYNETIDNCPVDAKCRCRICERSLSPAPSLEIAQLQSSDPMPADPSSSPKLLSSYVAHQTPLNESNATSSKISYVSKYACARVHPLVSANQELLEILDIIRHSRMMEGDERSALSYQRAISVLKAFPYRITSVRQVQKLPYIGTKINSMIVEFLDSGTILEARNIARSERFMSLSCLASIYGIGHATARKLYDQGIRTIEALQEHYAVDECDSKISLTNRPAGFTRAGAVNENSDIIPANDRCMVDDESSAIKVGLAIHKDLFVKIPRNEAEEIGRIIHAELCEIQPGCVYTIAGGYRRGKNESNDVDIVFTHPEPGRDRGLCKRLVDKLKERDMISHVMNLSTFQSSTALRNAQWNKLEKALTVFRLPSWSPYGKDRETGRALFRRVDLVFAPHEVYWYAIIGWTGSTMFERDLRRWAKDMRKWKFDSSGMTRLSDSSLIHARSEREVFELCGLEWVDPTLRNADV